MAERHKQTSVFESQGMPVVPVLMVLYTNDAVEVRYSDGSCLQVASCGSTFVHHESPSETIHPVHGVKTIHQRTKFVTSDYKHKVIEALDFRNRFAECPYICQDLIHQDQIVGLYADVREVAWPRTFDKVSYEYLPDGSVRLLSKDEYSSMVLSAHKQDFTVCYLSKVSQEKTRSRSNDCKFQAKSMCEPGRSENRKVVTDRDYISTGSSNHGYLKPEQYKDIKEIQTLEKDNGCSILTPRSNDGNVDSVQNGIEKSLHEDLSISPISVASSQKSQENSQEESDDFQRFSTPTYILQGEGQINIGQDDAGRKGTAFPQDRRKQYTETNDGSFLGINPPQVKNEIQFPESNAADSLLTPLNSEDSSADNTLHKSSENSTVTCQTSDDWSREARTKKPGKEDGWESSSRFLYTWVTRHFSCEECPVTWRHPVNLARTLLENKTGQKDNAEKLSDPKTWKTGYPCKIQPDKCCLCALPVPLTLTCPGQHLHKPGQYMYDNERSLEDNIMVFKQGKLKVILIEGGVFRLVRLASTLVIEIYPGDGSVILSQGLTGHFYKHVIPCGQDQVEERTYSLKSLPPTPPKAVYSIEKLLKRANRFLMQAIQEDKMITNADVCCWKYVDKKIEILPTSLLEDCNVPGYGKFTAYSNGHIRIVFHDRTSLEMTGDFSQRIQAYLEHSKAGETTQKNTGEETAFLPRQSVSSSQKPDLCKLLLPNGQYQIVNIKQPGVYSKYTNAALEWQAWVNSSPSQRKLFYKCWEIRDPSHIVAAKELQKIKCFKYLVENTMQTQNEDNPPSSLMDNVSSIRGRDLCQGRQSLEQNIIRNTFPTDLCNSASKLPNSNYSNYGITNHSNREQVHRNFGSPFTTSVVPVHSYLSSSWNFPEGSDVSESVRKYPKHQLSNRQIMLGFNSVREALLKTSQAIKDIDEILDNKCNDGNSNEYI